MWKDKQEVCDLAHGGIDLMTVSETEAKLGVGLFKNALLEI